MNRLYFAYGSNMHDMQMQTRCPDSRFIGVVRLKGWRFAFSPKHRGANIHPNDNGYVWGCLYEITKECEAALDSYEGVSDGQYQKIEVSIPSSPNKKALAYVVRGCTGTTNTYKDYYERILSALAHHNIEQSYIDHVSSNGCIEKSHPTRNYRDSLDGLGGL